MFFLMSGCQKALPNKPSALKTTQGIPLEMLLSKDSGLVIKVGTNDATQLNNLGLIFRNLPFMNEVPGGTTSTGGASIIQNVQDQFYKGLDQALSAYGVTYAADLKPILGDKVHFMVGMRSFPQPSSGGQGVMDMELVMPILDVEKVDQVARKLANNNGALQDNYRGVTFFQKGGTKIFITRLGDALVVTNSLEGLKSTIDRYQDVSASLLDNEFYQKSLAQMPANVGFMFVDPKGVSPAMYGGSQVGGQAATQASTSYLDEEKYFQALQGMYYAFSAEPNGLRILGREFGDAQVLKNNKINFLTLPHSDPYLYKKIPVDKALMYVENSDLKSLLNIELAVFEKMYKVADLKGKIQQFFASKGLDFEKDVLSFLDKGNSFVWRDSGNFMPNLAFYVDASSNPAGAQKTVDALHIFLQEVITQLGQKYKNIVQGFVFEDGILADGSKVHVLRFKSEGLESKSSSPLTQLLLNTPLELWYGVSKDNLAFVAFYPHFDQDFEVNAKTLANDADFKDTQTAMGKSLSNFVYFSPKVVAQYISHFGDIGAIMGTASSDPSIGAANSAQVKADQLVLESYFKPFKGIIFNSKAVSESEIDFSGYVLVKSQ
ncbi:MAG: DUF3352 domain-containing protein [Candidatus Gracilibacteria bacterium]